MLKLFDDFGVNTLLKSGVISKFLLNLANHASSRNLVLSAIVGLFGGLGAVLFYFAANSVDSMLLGGLAGYNPISVHGPVDPDSLPFIDNLSIDHNWLLFLLPALGGLISGYLVFRFAPEAEGHGTDAAIDAFHNKGGHITPLRRHGFPRAAGGRRGAVPCPVDQGDQSHASAVELYRRGHA